MFNINHNSNGLLNKIKRKIEHKFYYDKYYEILHSMKNASSKDIEKGFMKLFALICKWWWGFNKKTINTLLDELIRGNWDRYHLTEEEKAYDQQRNFSEFRASAKYFIDRYSLDRLHRLVYDYRRWESKAFGELYYYKNTSKNYRR